MYHFILLVRDNRCGNNYKERHSGSCDDGFVNTDMFSEWIELVQVCFLIVCFGWSAAAGNIGSVYAALSPLGQTTGFPLTQVRGVNPNSTA